MVTLLNEDAYDLLLNKYYFWNWETKTESIRWNHKNHILFFSCVLPYLQLYVSYSWLFHNFKPKKVEIHFKLIAIYHKNHFLKLTHKNTQVKDNFVYCLLMLSYKWNILLFEFLLTSSFYCCCCRNCVVCKEQTWKMKENVFISVFFNLHCLDLIVKKWNSIEIFM